MHPCRRGAIGILPPGALGVGFLRQLAPGVVDGSEAPDGRVGFLVRPGSRTGGSFAAGSALRLDLPSGPRELPLAGLHWGTPAEAARDGLLPEVILVATNPDQLHGVVDAFVGLVEQLAAAGKLDAVEDHLPLLVLASNGIFFQRLRQTLLERLEEGTLLGRLPDLWPDLMPRLVARLLRGVTLQTGLRDGEGADAVYRPGPPSLTRVAGLNAAARLRALEVLRARSALFEDAGNDTPTRTEFMKAMVNLASNLVGMTACIDAEGRFTPRTVGEVYSAERWPGIVDLIRAVVATGRAVRAFRPDEDDAVFVEHVAAIGRRHAGHVPSSIQWLEQALAHGTLEPRLSPTESWLLPPLLHYARNAGVPEAVRVFEAHEAALVEAFRKAIDHQRRHRGPGPSVSP